MAGTACQSDQPQGTGGAGVESDESLWADVFFLDDGFHDCVYVVVRMDSIGKFSPRGFFPKCNTFGSGS